MPFGPLALPNGAVVPGDTDPLQVGEDLLDGAVDLACAVGVVDPKQEPVTRRLFAPQTGRCRDGVSRSGSAQSGCGPRS